MDLDFCEPELKLKIEDITPCKLKHRGQKIDKKQTTDVYKIIQDADTDISIRYSKSLLVH